MVVGSATDTAIHKKIWGSGKTLTISNEEMDYILKIIKSLGVITIINGNNSPIRIYVNKTENRITFKIKTG